MSAKIAAPGPDTIREAAEILRNGRLLGLPTETVYGLAADARQGPAVARIFEAKGRPQFNPLIVHFHEPAQLEDYVVMDERARACATLFWPGPLTLILGQKPGHDVHELAMAGLSTMAVRIPSHPVAREVLKTFGGPVAAPSANLSGRLSPTSPKHVIQDLGDKIDLILAGGPSQIGLESTVLDLSDTAPVILRPGGINAPDLARALGAPPLFADDTPDDAEAPKSPGRTLRHYAPESRLRLNAVDLKPGEALLAFGSSRFIGIRGGGRADQLPENRQRNLSESGDLNEAAANLYAHLRDLDQSGVAGIAVMPVPDHGLGAAINERLRRAAQTGETPEDVLG